jgi:hypothetical protein
VGEIVEDPGQGDQHHGREGEGAAVQGGFSPVLRPHAPKHVRHHELVDRFFDYDVVTFVETDNRPVIDAMHRPNRVHVDHDLVAREHVGHLELSQVAPP